VINIKYIIKLILKLLFFIFPNLENKNKYEKKYVKKQYLTSNELVFYNKLIKIEDLGNFKVIPQVNLATIINKISNSYYQNDLYRNIDFAIFNKELTQLYLLIELNDHTHNYKNRRKRDIKVKEICNDANIKLITFHTKYSNKEEYIIERILNEININ